jgi:hypothetical protein
MWKILAAFIVFAALALFVIMKGGDKVDMQGEAGGHSPVESTTEVEPAPASPSAPATDPAPAAPAAEPAPATPAPSGTTGTSQ